MTTTSPPPAHGQINLNYTQANLRLTLDAIRRQYPAGETVSAGGYVDMVADYTQLLQDYRGQHEQTYAICMAVRTLLHSVNKNGYPWQPKLWGALVDLVKQGAESDIMASSDAASAAASSMAYMIEGSNDCPLTLKDMQPILAAIKSDKTTINTGHQLSQYVLTRFFERKGLLHAEDTAMVPTDLRRARRGKQLLRLGKAFYAAPRANTGYMHPIFVTLGGASDDEVLCNSGCQYGDASTLVMHWVQNVSTGRMHYAMPALFKGLRYLRGQQLLQPKKRAAVNRAIIAAGRTLFIFKPDHYKKMERYIPAGLRADIKNPKRKSPARKLER